MEPNDDKTAPKPEAKPEPHPKHGTKSAAPETQSTENDNLKTLALSEVEKKLAS